MRKKDEIISTKGAGRKTKSTSNSTTTTSLDDKSTVVSPPETFTPYDIFLRCIRHAENLINFHSEDKNPEEEHFCDAYRASIVLTIAALDAYIRTVAIIKIKEKLKKRPKSADPLCQYIKSIMTHDSLLECAMNDSFFSEIENQITNDFQKISFQGERKITFYMELAGYKNIFGIVSKKKNSNEHNLKSKIDDFTKRRHTIAHGGDYDINQLPFKELEIKKEFAVECRQIVCEFTETLNAICFTK